MCAQEVVATIERHVAWRTIRKITRLTFIL